MSGPARAGLFVYAKDLERLARFYEIVAGMTWLHAGAGIVITSPPQRRENSALKFFFTVASIAETTSIVHELGGVVFPEQWQGPGFVVNNACDPEGNVFQIRQSAA